MKNIFLILALCLSLKMGAQEIFLRGNYQGKNLIVMNPFASTGVGFCVFEVKINGLIATDEINSSSFEIDLTTYKLKKGDNLDVLLKYKDGCLPKVLNPEVLKPQSTFKIASILVDRKSETLIWTTTDENGKLPYVIQQFKWNKWMSVGEIEGKGTSNSNSYQFKINITSGENKFRIKQSDFNKNPRYSEEVIYRSLKANITYTVTKKSILFSSETAYEIYDIYGKKLLSGFGNSVALDKLPKGKFFLNYDNQMSEFKL